MINLDGTQTVNDLRKWLDMPEGTLVHIHLKYGEDAYCDLEDARHCYNVHRMFTQYECDDLVVHLYNF